MSESAATLVFAAIMGSGFLVWLWSLGKALRLGRVRKSTSDWTEKRLLEADPEPEGAVERGERTLRGDPEKLSKELVRSFLQGNLGTSLFEVVERTARRVELRKTGPLVVNQPPGLYFSEAEFELEPLADKEVRVRYRLGFARLVRRMRRVALAIIFGIGLPVMLAVGILIWVFVVRSDEEAVRWQVFQCIHIGHALWPPFLFLWLHSLGRRHAKAFVTNLLTTLELVE